MVYQPKKSSFRLLIKY